MQPAGQDSGLVGGHLFSAELEQVDLGPLQRLGLLELRSVDGVVVVFLEGVCSTYLANGDRSVIGLDLYRTYPITR